MPQSRIAKGGRNDIEKSKLRWLPLPLNVTKMTDMTSTKLRLNMPQWQGGNEPAYRFGAELLAFLRLRPLVLKRRLMYLPRGGGHARDRCGNRRAGGASFAGQGGACRHRPPLARTHSGARRGLSDRPRADVLSQRALWRQAGRALGRCAPRCRAARAFLSRPCPRPGHADGSGDWTSWAR